MQTGGDAKVTNKKRLGLAIPKKLYDFIKEESEEYGKTINSLCIDIFWDYFKEKECEKNA